MKNQKTKFSRRILIGNKRISKHSPVFIIAEAGVNHNGDIVQAKELIKAAAWSGADAVKFQAFKTENLILNNVSKAPYQRISTSNDETQFAMLKKLELSMGSNKQLQLYAQKCGLIFLTTPFDEQSLEELIELDLPAYKIASTDLTNLPFLIKVAKTKKPIILSTGMSFQDEISSALSEIGKFNRRVVVLQCTANYPISDEEANLRVISSFQDKFNALIGYSDHTMGVGASPYAVALGARVIEKHLTLDKSAKGPDQRTSLEPLEFKQLVLEIRKVEKYLGDAKKKPTPSERMTRKALQKCLVAMSAIKKGDKFSFNNVIAKRTGGRGINPNKCYQLFKMRAKKNYKKNDII